MKIRNFMTKGWWLLAIGLGFAACNEDIHDFTKKTGSGEAIDIYIADSIFTYSVSWSADTVRTGADTVFAKFPVCVATPVEDDVTVILVLDDKLVDSYNTVHGTTYKTLLAANLSTSNLTVTIPAGKTESEDSVIIRYTKKMSALDDTSGYLVPIRIRTYKGPGVALNYNERHSYLFVNVNRENGVYFNGQSMDNLNIVGKNVVDLNTLSLKLLSYYGVHDTSTVTVSVKNDLIAAYNAANGTEYQPVSALTQSYKVGFAAGQKEESFKLACSAAPSTLNDGRGYLIPLEITTVEGDNIASVTARKNFLVRLDVSTIYCDAVSVEEMSGTEVADKSGYSVVKATNSSTGASLSKPDNGAWTSSFDGSVSTFWYMRATTSLTIDLGAEVSNITGIRLIVNNNLATNPYDLKEVDVAFSTEAMYAKGKEYPTGTASVSGGSSSKYIKFSEPVTARYIHLNKMANNNAYGMVFCSEFYIYTQP